MSLEGVTRLGGTEYDVEWEFDSSTDVSVNDANDGSTIDTATGSKTATGAVSINASTTLTDLLSFTTTSDVDVTPDCTGSVTWTTWTGNSSVTVSLSSGETTTISYATDYTNLGATLAEVEVTCDSTKGSPGATIDFYSDTHSYETITDSTAFSAGETRNYQLSGNWDYTSNLYLDFTSDSAAADWSITVSWNYDTDPAGSCSSTYTTGATTTIE